MRYPLCLWPTVFAVCYPILDYNSSAMPHDSPFESGIKKNVPTTIFWCPVRRNECPACWPRKTCSNQVCFGFKIGRIFISVRFTIILWQIVAEMEIWRAKSKDSKCQNHWHNQDFNNDLPENEGKTGRYENSANFKSKAHLIAACFAGSARGTFTPADATSKNTG